MSTDKLLQHFNLDLRNKHNYPETFTVKPEHSFNYGRLILIPDQKSKLLELIKTNPRTKQELLNDIERFLPIRPIDLYFSTHGEDIIINFVLKEMISLDTGLFSIIGSYLNIDDLENYCEALFLCDKQEFWIIMTREQFPQWYVESRNKYNWGEVYRGLFKYGIYLKSKRLTELNQDLRSLRRKKPIAYKESMEEINREINNLKLQNIREEDYEPNLFWNKMNSETIKYLINLNILSDRDKYSILSVTKSLDIFRKLIDTVRPPDYRISIFSNVLTFDDRDLIEHTKNKLDLPDDIIEDAYDLLMAGISPTGFDVITKGVDKTPDVVFRYLRFLHQENHRMVDYLIDMLPVELDADYLIDRLFVLIEDSQNNIVIKLVDKYKPEFTKTDMRAIEELVLNTFDKTTDETLVDFFEIEIADDLFPWMNRK